MQYELYIDIFAMENFLMNYTILLLMKKVLKSNVSSLKIGVAAMAGAAVSSLVICSSLPHLLKELLVYLLGSLVMLKLAFAITVSNYIRNMLLLYIIGTFVGGIFVTLYQSFGKQKVTIILFFSITLISYLLITYAIDFLGYFRKNIETQYNVILQWRGNKVKCTALYDTGNRLVDKITGKPVNIISIKGIKKFTNTYEILRYIPYVTIQGENQVMPLIKLDRMYIQGKSKKIIDNPYIAISDSLDFGNGDYELILHPDCLQEDRDDDKNCG